jgi:hypothetical protein
MARRVDFRTSDNVQYAASYTPGGGGGVQGSFINPSMLASVHSTDL